MSDQVTFSGLLGEWLEDLGYQGHYIGTLQGAPWCYAILNDNTVQVSNKTGPWYITRYGSGDVHVHGYAGTPYSMQEGLVIRGVFSQFDPEMLDKIKVIINAT
jgi:hypothetical protein